LIYVSIWHNNHFNEQLAQQQQQQQQLAMQRQQQQQMRDPYASRSR
jgi:hypothetical protein